MNGKILRGRGAQINPKNRFEKLHIEDFDDAVTDVSLKKAEEIKLQTYFYKDDSRSVISENDSYDLGFDYSFNPYRGCEHGCIYCYARPTHEFLGFSSGTDFETKIMVKPEADRLLEKAFKKKSYVPKVVMFSGNTDCYQPVEKKMELTRKALQVCLKYKNPVAIITKNSLIQRDIDILKELALLGLTTVTISVTTLKKDLARKMEPRTSIPELRLHTIEEIAKHGIPVGVNLAPIIPGLTDEEIPKILKEAASRGAEHASYIMLRLPYAVKDLFIDWVNKEFPDRSNKIINRIKEIRNGKLNQSEFKKRFTGEGEFAETIRDLFKINCKKLELNRKDYAVLRTDLFNGNDSDQMEMF